MDRLVRALMLALWCGPLAALAAPIPFSVFIRLDTGMSEAEVLELTGPPDYVSDGGSVRYRTRHGFAWGDRKSMTWYADGVEPHTTTITFRNGRVSDIERYKKF